MRDQEATNDHAAVPIYQAKKGDRFRLPKEYGIDDVFVFDRMDGLYSFARRETDGQILNWCGPVVLETEQTQD